MGKTFLSYNLNNDKVGDIYLVMYSKLKSNKNLIENNNNNNNTSKYTQLLNNNNQLSTISNSLLNENNDNDINFINGIHYTLVIDVGGESLTNVPIGLEVHITAEKSTNLIQLDFERKFKLNKMYNEKSIYLGKIENIYHSFNPLEWSFGLTRIIATNWFYDFIYSNSCSTKVNNKSEDTILSSSSTQYNNPLFLWSNEKNCLTFSKFIIQKFNYNNSLNIIWPLN